MENLFSIASEAYQGDSSIRPLVRSIGEARRAWQKGKENEAFRILKDMAKDIKEIFNFKGVTVNLNATTLGPHGNNDPAYGASGATSSVAHIVYTYGTQKNITNKDIEIMHKTYRFKEPLVYCNLSIYGPRVLGDDLYTDKEVVAMIVREVAYAFYAWTGGRKALHVMSQVFKVLGTIAVYNDENSTTGDKISSTLDTGVYIAPSYIKDFEGFSEGPTKSGFMKFMDKVGATLGTVALVICGPIVAAMSVFALPIMAVAEMINKVFGVSYDEVDKFTDQFVASYGLGAEIASATNKTKRQNLHGVLPKSFNNFLDLYSEIFLVSAISYCWTTDNVGCVSSGASLPRIESMIIYYEQQLEECKGSKEVSAEIKEKIKALKQIYENLRTKPRENYTPSALVAKLWAKLFGSDTVAINRLDDEIEKIKKKKKGK